MGIQLTKSQQAVVEDRGGRVLVSAAAGSGKTRCWPCNSSIFNS